LIKAKKSLGQNFLTDASVARRIVDAVSPQRSDIILEIGPGTGALTRLLVERSGFVVAVEIDSRLASELKSRIVNRRLSVIEADALTVNWDELISSRMRSWNSLEQGDEKPARVRVVANLPYYISTPIIERLIHLQSPIHDLTLMLQNEVAGRITSGPGSKEYGYLSVLVQYHTTATKLFEVPPSAFSPVPKVQSAIIRLEARSSPVVIVSDESKFFAMVRAAFAQRRKTILNNLKAAQDHLQFERPIESALKISGIDCMRRAETVSLEEFGDLYRSLFVE
jgi:16S rRNA (adenine1518-N6/adenine1519-N6)-dimethyltransferase